MGMPHFPGAADGQESLVESLIMEKRGEESRYVTVQRWKHQWLGLYSKSFKFSRKSSQAHTQVRVGRVMSHSISPNDVVGRFREGEKGSLIFEGWEVRLRVNFKEVKAFE